jgi:hypothetical protein
MQTLRRYIHTTSYITLCGCFHLARVTLSGTRRHFVGLGLGLGLVLGFVVFAPLTLALLFTLVQEEMHCKV